VRAGARRRRGVPRARALSPVRPAAGRVTPEGDREEGHLGRHHASRHRHGHHRGRRPHRPGRHEVHRARARGQALAILVLAGGVLASLLVYARLLVGERDGTPPSLARPAGTAPRQ